MSPKPPTEPPYDRAEIVEDRTRERLLSCLFRGGERLPCHSQDLRWDYADADMDELRKELVEQYRVSPDQITTRVEGGTTRPRRRGASGRSRGRSPR